MATRNKCRIIELPRVLRDDKCGSVRVAKIQGLCGDLTHTLVQNVDYRGVFLPGFKSISDFSISASLYVP